jgi:hypothetical protein
LDWWAAHAETYPALSKMARKYLCVPACSANSERVWSLAGNIITKKRTRLTPELVHELIFLHKNSVIEIPNTATEVTVVEEN